MNNALKRQQTNVVMMKVLKKEATDGGDFLTGSNVSEWAVQRIETLETAILELKRGCECGYDYRCGQCQNIITIHRLVEIKENDFWANQEDFNG